MTPTMSTPVDKKTRTGRALSANPSQPLNDSVTDQLAAIPDLSRNDLIERWTQAYSRPPPRGLSRRLLEYADVSPFFVFPEAVPRIVYTTNAIESLNAKIRRAVRTRGHFPSDEAASKLLYLVLDHAAEGVETSAAGMVRGRNTVRRHLRRKVRQCLTKRPEHKSSDTPLQTILRRRSLTSFFG